MYGNSMNFVNCREVFTSSNTYFIFLVNYIIQSSLSTDASKHRRNIRKCSDLRLFIAFAFRWNNSTPLGELFRKNNGKALGYAPFAQLLSQDESKRAVV